VSLSGYHTLLGRHSADLPSFRLPIVADSTVPASKVAPGGKVIIITHCIFDIYNHYGNV
jgi:hypothetical protein